MADAAIVVLRSNVELASWRGMDRKTFFSKLLVLVRLDPPLIGQRYGQGARDIDLLVLATRHQGTSMFPVSEWPLYVHVALPLVPNPDQRDSLEQEELESIAWAELYETEEAAKAKAV